MLYDILFWVGIVIAFILVVFFVPQWILVRNIPKVIRIFRNFNAINPKTALTVEELGLKPKPMLERMFRRRDNKPRALQYMLRVAMVEVTEDGKLYLNEEKLTQTRWHNL
ncbi:MAG: hypothetical protein V3R92_03565 [Dehalococcoidales bacterium]